MAAINPGNKKALAGKKALALANPVPATDPKGLTDPAEAEAGRRGPPNRFTGLAVVTNRLNRTPAMSPYAKALSATQVEPHLPWGPPGRKRTYRLTG